MLPKHLFALPALALLVSVATAAEPHVGQAAGRVDHVEGPAGAETIEVRNGPAVNTMGIGDTLYVGDHVVTSAQQSVAIVLNDQSEIVVGPSSDFTVKQPYTEQAPATTVSLLYGMLHAVVEKIYSDEKPFVVETPSGVMGVRGTEFIVEHDAKATESAVHTLEGSVAMAKSPEELRRPTAHALVTAGMMTSMQRGMASPPAPRKFERAAFFEHLKQRAPLFTRHVEYRQAQRQQRRQNHSGQQLPHHQPSRPQRQEQQQHQLQQHQRQQHQQQHQQHQQHPQKKNNGQGKKKGRGHKGDQR
ncbi:MAG: FecR domain-containing protein [Deltaproteobacteria bacterium]|nr:FecR domain-containing protein [Deltaproteobacteria bacterium]